MSIKLVFNGGFFSAQPGAGRVERVDILSKGYSIVIQPPDDELKNALEGATRIDFETRAPLNANRMLIREIAHIIPIDYRKFERFISFNGGTVTPIPADKTFKMDRPDLFTATTGVPVRKNHYDDILLAEFQAQVAAGMHERWVVGYKIQVEIPRDGVQIIIDGHHDHPLDFGGPDVQVSFEMHEENEISHFPYNNPHVLEQPPTI